MRASKYAKRQHYKALEEINGSTERIMSDLIFIVREGPSDKPGRFYPARVLRAADSAKFYIVQELSPAGDIVEDAPTRTVHHNDICLSWFDMKARQNE